MPKATKLLIVVGMALLSTFDAFCGEAVTYESAGAGFKFETFAIYSGPSVSAAKGGKSPAVVFIHSAGGYADGTVSPMAKVLNDNGFSTLELRLFERRWDPAKWTLERMSQSAFGAIKYLSTRPEVDAGRVGIAGFSLGGYPALWTASEWMTSNYGNGFKFAAHAPLYVPCWQQAKWAKGQVVGQFPLTVPKDFLTRFTGASVRIFAAGKDDYDDRDSNACKEFVATIDEKYRSSFDVTTYMDATHGWNQSSTNFYTSSGCKGKGCFNRNINNPAVTAQNTQDVLNFFSEKLKP
jgi:dienelactone hydrolase